MSGFIYLNALIKRAVDSLFSIAENIYSELLQRGNSDHIWIKHYRLATSNLELLQNELERSAVTANNIYAKASRGISKERLEEIRQEAIRYGSDANEFCEQMLALVHPQPTLANRNNVMDDSQIFNDFLTAEDSAINAINANNFFHVPTVRNAIAAVATTPRSANA